MLSVRAEETRYPGLYVPVLTAPRNPGLRLCFPPVAVNFTGVGVGEERGLGGRTMGGGGRKWTHRQQGKRHFNGMNAEACIDSLFVCMVIFGFIVDS